MSVLEQPVSAPILPPPLAAIADVGARPAQAPNATMVVRTELTDSMAVFGIVLDSPAAGFKPGQYVSMGVIDEGTLLQRAYSVVGLSADGYRIELFIRKVPDGALSPRLWQLTPGARVKVGPPKGLFVLDAADSRPRLFIGTGTGLAPLLAMLAALADDGDQSPNVLIHGVSHQTELAYREAIGRWVSDGLDLWYVPSVSRPDDQLNAGWKGATGRADAVAGRVLESDSTLARGVAYMCGNPSMIESCSTVLRAAGMADADIRSEKFHTPARAT
jgi:ferredoxin-NADP reductase